MATEPWEIVLDQLDIFIKRFPMLVGENKDLAREIVGHSAHKVFTAGTQLYTLGDACPGIAFLLSGEVRVYMIGQTGREITLYDILPGETCVLNASCIMARCNYMANAETLQEGAMLYLDHKTFMQLMSASGEMQFFIFSFFSQRFAEIIELVEEVTFGKMDQRLADFLVAKAENERLHITHQTIANELGSSREVISRLLKDFERKGRIELARHFIKIKHL